MKTILILLCLAFFIFGCKAYKPIEKAVYPNDAGLSSVENMQRQLTSLEPGEKLEVELKSGKTILVTFQKVDSTTLYANYNLPKNKMPVDVPFEDIQSVKVWKANLPLTAGLVAAGVIVGLMIINESMGNWFEGFTIPVP